jgi:Bacterial Ig-like domain (group 3)
MRDTINTLIFYKCCLLAIVLVAATSMDASTKASITQLVVPAPTVTVLAQPAGPSFASTALPLRVMITAGSGMVIPNGDVTLTDNSDVIGNASVDNGYANFIQGSSSIGSHQFVACYGGIANFSSSCSAPIGVSILPPYLLDQTKSSGTVNAPKNFVDDLQVIPANGFVGIVQFTCKVSSYSCNLSPSSVSLSGNGKTQVVKASFSPAATSTSAELFGWPIVGLLGITFGKRRLKLGNVCLALGSVAFMCCTGCGPVISVPVNSTTQTMTVTSQSGLYTQAVTYQIQVVTDVIQ